MNDRIHAGVSALAAFFVFGTLLIRWAVTGGRGEHRGPRRPRRVEEFVPAHHLIPALARPVFAHCHGCHAEVPVTVHGTVRHCDNHHLTTTGD